MNEPAPALPEAPASDQPARPNLRWSVVGAVVLFLIDIVLFMPGIGLVLSLIRALIAGASAMARQMFRPAAAKAPAMIMVIYLACLLAIIMGMKAQEQIGLHNAEPLIEALRQYRHESGEWPQNLEALVPRYLPSIPLSSYRLTGNRYHFAHSEQGTYLYFYPAPPTVYNEFNFETGTWHLSTMD